MAPDNEIPEHDPLAESTRRALARLAETDSTDSLSWVAVQSRARRLKVMRATTAIAACVIVLAGAGVAIGTASHDQDHINISGPTGSSTTTSKPAPTTPSTPAPTTPVSTPGTCAPVPCGTSVVGPPGTAAPQGPGPVSQAPGPSDFAGTMALDGKSETTWTMAPGDGVDIAATVRNLTDHAIWASDADQPTSIATVCTGETSGRTFLWWMTNILVQPGERSGREGTFTPTDLDVGRVRCEVDIVAPDPKGPVFDTDAGGDDARATIIGRVAAITPVVITVQSPTDTTTTVPTATTVPAPTTTTP